MDLKPRRRLGAALPLAALTLLVATLGGCATSGYYWQAVRGHLELMRQRRPIVEVISDPATPSGLRDTLRRVQAMRRFAVTDLGLPDNGSYLSYAALDRPYVIWNVFAAPPLAITPREWCFPVAGCVAYRGYFKRADAEALAAELRQAGDDAYVGGVPAYSTLGWMNDPVLSTFIHWPDAELARLLFHELAHQVAYAPGDTPFNEAFATAVEEEGVARWIARARPELAGDWEQEQTHRQGFLALVLDTQQDLAKLYASAASDADKRAGKRARLNRMREDYHALKVQWGGFAGYDHWFAQEVNNAQLASIAVYTRRVPGFRQLLREQGDALPAFYQRIRELAKASQAQRDAALAAVLSRVPAPAPAPAPAEASAAGSGPAPAPPTGPD